MAPADDAGIFISYRRADTRADAGRLYDRLAARFGEERVFMDIDDIPPGQDFREVLKRTLDSCSALLVLIGPDWAGARGDNGDLRLQDEADYVRLEVASALQRGIPVIPVLFNRATLPSADSLPQDLRGLVSRQAVEIRDARFSDDVEALLDSVGTAPGLQARATPLRWTAIALALLLAIAGAWWWFGGGADPSEAGATSLSLRSEPQSLTEPAVIALLREHDLFDAAYNPQGAGPADKLELVQIGDVTLMSDPVTGLQWQHGGIGRQRSFDRVQQRIDEMNAEAHGGFTDWRLPTLAEAASLLRPQAINGAHQSALLLPQDAGIMWTADTTERGRHWVVYSFGGEAGVVDSRFNAWLRAVRSER